MSDKFLKIFVVLLWVFLIYQFINSVKGVTHYVPILYGLESKIMNCSKIEVKSSNKKVVFRFDDVQAYAYTTITEKMINDSLNKGFPMVLGIIPKGLEMDTNLVHFIAKNRCNLEIAAHGWDHSTKYIDDNPYIEFQNLSEGEALKRYKQSAGLLKQLFFVTPHTFIPPENKISIEARDALKETEFKRVSADNGDRFDMTIATVGVNDDLIKVDILVEACENAFSYGNACVVVIHPQDYLTYGVMDDTKYATYQSMLQKFKELAWQGVTFDELDK